ncbi:hypothetical protein YC2023_064317 [Brassica napus]
MGIRCRRVCVYGRMNQGGGNTQTVAPLDPNPIEKRYGVDGSQVQISPYQYSIGSHTVVDNHVLQNVNYSNSNYYHHPPQPPLTGNVQETPNTISSTSGTANVAQDYSGYTPYQTSSDTPQNYSNAGYSNYYSGYQQQQQQQQPSLSGAYQNTGAPYQPISSFQNPGSYPAATASYSGTYYNPADYQTTGGYQTTNYNNQTAGGYQSTTYSNQAPTPNQGNYSANPYQNYTPDAANTHSSTVASATTTPVHYQQSYQQWPAYYSQTEVVPCAPGTEKLSATSAVSQSFPVPGVTNETPASNGQPVPSYAQPWRQETNLSQPSSQQPAAAVSASNDAYWKHQTQNQQAHYPVPPQNHYQSPLVTKPLYETPFQGHQRDTYPQGMNSQSSVHQAPLGYRQPTQTTPSVDTQRVSKIQIPTNPRIASNLPSGYTKMDKGSSAAGAIKTPAYVSVSVPKPKGHANAVPEPGTLPKSLCGFVERAFARCKDDKEKASCQAAMKKVITEARDDGTLHTRDWDTEPLSTVLNADVTNTEAAAAAGHTSFESFQKADAVTDSKPTYSWQNSKPAYSWQNSAKKSFQRPVKRQRFSGGADDEASSDSDKDSTPSAMSFATSAEETKRRDSRSKRFEKVQGHSRRNDIPKPMNANVGNLHSRRGTALRFGEDFDESGCRSVEDIDWNALTVKGTCQEIEKRYFRLTSAPDPSAVRPEDVLEISLLMVQDSQKNYLYKCDQLKSIRQDLTVQRIHNHLTVKVYETHARLALEAGDLPEYNQCLSQLKILYADGIEGCSLEFAAYSLLYITLHSNNNRELLSSMSRLSKEAKKDEAVRHALSVRAAVTSGNYVVFFRLYKTAPNMNSFLMDLYVEKMRYKAVTVMSRSCRPTVPVSYLAQVLGFTNTSSEGSGEKETDSMEACSEWLKAHGASLIADSNGDMLLDTKVSTTNLFMPEPEDAVAHGDKNLDVNDFFTRTS